MGANCRGAYYRKQTGAWVTKIKESLERYSSLVVVFRNPFDVIHARLRMLEEEFWTEEVRAGVLDVLAERDLQTYLAWHQTVLDVARNVSLRYITSISVCSSTMRIMNSGAFCKTPAIQRCLGM